MTLQDTRPIATITTASSNPSVVGEDLAHLLVEHPDLELASIRLYAGGDGVVIVGRVGLLAEPECPELPHRGRPPAHRVLPAPHPSPLHLPWTGDPPRLPPAQRRPQRRRTGRLMGTHDEWDDNPDEAGPDCECDAPDPDDSDEPWVPIRCANCGGLW